jgi:hypothetical protein
MADLKIIARLVRWGAESMAFNLTKIPADKLDWKPDPAAKSALQVTGEVVGVMNMLMPVFTNGELKQEPLPHPRSLEEAQAALAETSEKFAAALEAAGPELEHPIPSPFGGEMWGAYAVLFGVIDLIHHHGQVTYIQSLLGDAEVHGDPEAIGRWFGPPAG